MSTYKEKQKQKQAQSLKQAREIERFTANMPRSKQVSVANAVANAGEHTESLKAHAEMMVIGCEKPVDTRNVDEIGERFIQFVNICANYDIRPTMTSMCLCFGISVSLYEKILSGDVKRDNDVVSTFEQIRMFLNAELEHLAYHNKINPATGIFLMKNHIGYKDSKDIQLVQIDNDSTDIESIKKRYMLDTEK